MPKSKPSASDQVSAHIQKLPAIIQPAVEYLRQLMLSIHTDIAEHIKWNSPSFYYKGEMKESDPKEYKRDILVMNLRKDKIMCVLPTGMWIKKNTEFLEGSYTDGRRMITFSDLADIKSKEKLLKKTILEWLDGIDK